MTGRILIVLVLVFCPIIGYGEEPKDGVDIEKLRLSLLNHQDDDRQSVGLEFKINGRYHPYTGMEVAYRKSAWLAIRSEGMLVADQKLNSTGLRAEGAFGGSLNLFRPQESEPGEEEGVEVVTQEGFNLGRLSAGFNVGYETDQSLDNRNFTAGGELAYVLTENAGWKALVPSFHAYYERVDIDQSDLQEALNVEDDYYKRFRIAASWKVPIGSYLPKTLEPLSFHVDARYFKDEGRPEEIENRDYDESTYIAGALNYTFDKPTLFGMLSSVFIKVSDGRIPPATEESTQIHLGVNLWEEERTSLK